VTGAHDHEDMTDEQNFVHQYRGLMTVLKTLDANAKTQPKEIRITVEAWRLYVHPFIERLEKLHIPVVIGEPATYQDLFEAVRRPAPSMQDLVDRLESEFVIFRHRKEE
jgi:hypothetical protein